MAIDRRWTKLGSRLPPATGHRQPATDTRADKNRAHAGAIVVQLLSTIYQQCVLRIADGPSET